MTAMPEYEQMRPGRRPPMVMAMPSTFADMLRMLSPELLERLELPWWLLFPPVYERRDQASLTQTDQERFVCALTTLINNGTYGQLVAIHAQVHYQHGTQRFLPWHRVFLLIFEQALRSVHPDVSIPYWDWTQASEQAIPGWLVPVLPTVPMPPPQPPMTVVRSPQSPADLATIVSNVPAVEADTTFAAFTSGLEAIHGAVHVWVGGNMGAIPTAPSDPIFWMHHANVDRLWWQWQQAHPGLNPNLTGTGPDSPVMDPWPYTEADTRDITAMGYTYA
jgi:tyrosinase